MIAISDAFPGDAGALLELQKLAFQSEARIYNDWSIPPLIEPIESVLEEITRSIVLKATIGDRLVGSVRGRKIGDVCAISRLFVHPELRGKGVGSQLLTRIEERFKGVSTFELFTGNKSEANLRLYQRLGYAIVRTKPISPTVSLIYLEKRAK